MHPTGKESEPGRTVPGGLEGVGADFAPGDELCATLEPEVDKSVVVLFKSYQKNAAPGVDHGWTIEGKAQAGR